MSNTAQMIPMEDLTESQQPVVLMFLALCYVTYKGTAGDGGVLLELGGEEGIVERVSVLPDGRVLVLEDPE